MADPVITKLPSRAANGALIPQQGQWIVVAIPARHIYAAKEGAIIKTVTEFSTGRAGYLTPTGTFQIDPNRRYRIHHSSEFSNKNGKGPSMLFSLFFHYGAAFHCGDPHVPSHGGIHLQLADAEWLFNWVGNNQVGVKISGPAITVHE
jgi:lipoprotein-anchoring transpeptidase ErfK/SrfK